MLKFYNNRHIITSFVIILYLVSSASAFNFFKSRNPVQPRQEEIGIYEDFKKTDRKIFDYERNGVKVDLRIVPALNNSIRDEDDHFPAFPVKDIGRCILDFSMTCIRERMAKYISSMTNLERINLYGKSVKLVKIRSLPARAEERSLDPVRKIDQSIDDFFDTFALRISLPKDNRKREINQIEVKYDDKAVGEARGGKGGGGKGGGKGGGGCKKMMMCMVMAAKMKMMGMIGLMSMKGLMMAGISMMMTKAMLIMQLMSKKGGGGGGGGGYSGGGGGQLKEIVLLTKASGGGGGGGCGGGGCGGGSPPSSSYGAPPPPSSYGAPPPTGGGGGGYDFNAQGGGGGWGRSFNNGQPDVLSTNRPPQIVEAIYATQPEQKLDWMSLENYQPEQERIGEVVELAESSNNFINQRSDRKLSIKEEDNDHVNQPEIVYANNWKNYEVADRIWDNVGPIVATRVVEAHQSAD